MWETHQFYEIKNSLFKKLFFIFSARDFLHAFRKCKNLSILYTCFTFCLHYNQHSLFLNELFILILYKKFYFCYNHVWNLFWKQEWNNKFFVFRYCLLRFLQDTLLWFILQRIGVPTWQLSTRRLVAYQVLSQVVVQS